MDKRISRHNRFNRDYKQGHNMDSDGCFKVGHNYKTGLKYDAKSVQSSLGGQQLPTNSKRVKRAAPGGVRRNRGVDYRNLTSVVKNQGKGG